MASSPKILQQLISLFRRFPGVGAKSAERFVYHLLKMTPKERTELAASIESLSTSVSTCTICGRYDSASPCTICADTSRDHRSICVVASQQDIQAIEKTGEFKGVYHILGGVLSPLEGVTPDRLSISRLVERVKTARPAIAEIIIATDADLEGESTAVYLARILKPTGTRVSRLAKGLPVGSNIEYADEITLSSALKDRKQIS